MRLNNSNIGSTKVDAVAKVDKIGIYTLAFHQMYKHIEAAKENIVSGYNAYNDVQRPILQLVDNETDIFGAISRASSQSLLVETGKLMMQLFTLYGIEYEQFDIELNNMPLYSKLYIPFYRIEKGNKVAYIFTLNINANAEWGKIRDKCQVDRIKVIALVEMSNDITSFIEMTDFRKRKSKDFVQYLTLKDFFTLISKDEYDLYKFYADKFNKDVGMLIGYKTLVVPSARSLDQLKEQIVKELEDSEYEKLLLSKNIYNKQIKIITKNFWERKLYKALLGKRAFAESFISSEWYYQTHTAFSVLEQTAIITGYLKSVEQLLYLLAQFSIDTGKKIRKKSKGEDNENRIEYCTKNLEMVDMTMGSIICYIKGYSDLWDVNCFVKKWIISKLNDYREKYRNEYFHKDNLNSIEEIREIRSDTMLIHFLLLGAMKISDINIKRIVIEDDKDKKHGLEYTDFEQWLDRILGGDMLLSADSHIFFDTFAGGTNKNGLRFNTVSGFSDEGVPQNMVYPYIADVLKWDLDNEDKLEVTQMLKQYLEKGKYSENLKVYKSVSVGWGKNYTVLYKR